MKADAGVRESALETPEAFGAEILAEESLKPAEHEPFIVGEEE